MQPLLNIITACDVIRESKLGNNVLMGIITIIMT